MGVAVEAESWSALTDAEVTAIFGAAYNGMAWDSGITVDTTAANSYQGNASVLCDPTANTQRPGIAWRDKLVRGDAAAIRVWTALKMTDPSSSEEAWFGIMRYDSSGAYVSESHVIVNSSALGSWTLVQSVFAHGDCAFYRPYVVHNAKATAVGTVRIGLLDCGGMPLTCRVALSADQDVSAASEEVIEFASEVYDYGGCFSTVTHRFTAPVAGVYLVTLATASKHATDLPDAGMQVSQSVYINAGGGSISAVCQGNQTAEDARYVTAPSVGYTWTMTATEQVYLEAGDYLEPKFYSSDGSTIQIRNLPWTTFQVTLVR